MNAAMSLRALLNDNTASGASLLNPSASGTFSNEQQRTGSSTTSTVLGVPVSTVVMSTAPMSTASVPLSTSIGGITRIGIVKASEMGELIRIRKILFQILTGDQPESAVYVIGSAVYVIASVS